MALVWRTVADAANHQAYIRVRYETSNNRVDRVEWANLTEGPRRCRVIREDNGTVVFDTVLDPGAQGGLDVPTGQFRWDQFFVLI